MAQRWLDCDPAWEVPVVSSEPEEDSPFRRGDKVRFKGSQMTGTVRGFVVMDDGQDPNRVFARGCIEVSLGDLWGVGCTGGVIYASHEYFRALGKGGYNPAGPTVFTPPDAIEKIGG